MTLKIWADIFSVIVLLAISIYIWKVLFYKDNNKTKKVKEVKYKYYVFADQTGKRYCSKSYNKIYNFMCDTDSITRGTYCGKHPDKQGPVI